MTRTLPDETDRYIGSGFRKDLETLINQHSMENGSDTPDFILADYLTGCLRLFDDTVRARKDQDDLPELKPLSDQPST